MIDERMEEQAALHVLGALSETEAREFKQAMLADPELQNLVARLSAATNALAGSVPAVDPPPQLRVKVLAQIESPQKVVTLPERKSQRLSWWPWVFANALAIICVVLLVQDSQLRKTIGDQAQAINHLNQMAQALQMATNHLQQTVLALQETNRMANLKIAMLNSLLADEPKAVAVSLWDENKQEGVFVVQNLKSLPADKDYQLWVLDNGTTPVDAGVFQVDKNGAVRVNFKAKQRIKVAGRFAVTEEVRGGVASPTITKMVLASN